MFTYKRIIYLRETDATGGIYFSNLLNLAGEALELYFLSKGFSLQKMLQEADFLLPIVRAEADYTAPLHVGDEVEISLNLAYTGTSSFTLQTTIFDIHRRLEIGRTKIVHVVIAPSTHKSMPIPTSLLTQLQLL